MKKRSKIKEGLFIIANLGKASEVNLKLLKDKFKIIKDLMIDAFSVDLKDRKDILAINEIYSFLKDNHTYLLGGIDNLSYLDKAVNIDAFKVKFNLLKKSNYVKRILDSYDASFFIYLPSNISPHDIKKLTIIAKKSKFPLPVMLTNTKRDIFRSLYQLCKSGKIYVGYTDTTPGVVSSIVCLSRGAQIVEKKLILHNASNCKSSCYRIDEFKIFVSLLLESLNYLD
ncbi:MAG: N-acetylneuraminate synthase family protein [Candidatus Omnitrophica bacterium]|nr:N-acetylneuraminate synthase family protein [Candidatus Omnitrophota bacterium]